MTAGTAGQAARPAPARDFPFTASDFRQIAAIAREEAGISLPEIKEPLVYSRLVKRVRGLGLRSFEQYCALIASRDGVDERMHMISALTTNVTRFFREDHHFRHLEEVALPPLLAAARKGARLRLWSAGCSSGEEAYCLAFTLLRACPEAAKLDVKVLASDIDPQILQIAEAGRYRAAEMAQLPDWVARYLRPDEGTATRAVGDQARALVSFRRLNLIRPWPVRGPFDVVFCRNVAIYFEPATQATLWQGFAGAMASGGFLYIGHSERMPDTMRAQFVMAGMTTYRRLDGSAAEKGDRQWH